MPTAASSAATIGHHVPLASLRYSSWSSVSSSRPSSTPRRRLSSSSSSHHRRLFHGGVTSQKADVREIVFSKDTQHLTNLTKKISVVPRCSGPSRSNEISDSSSGQSKAPFGYTRKDVILIGVGVTVLGIGLKYGLEFVGVDPLQAGNVVQLVLVLGLTVGWISTYIFRVSNKEMTYAQQLRDYENKVMQKRLESLTEAELEALLEQVEEEKGQQPSGEQII